MLFVADASNLRVLSTTGPLIQSRPDSASIIPHPRNSAPDPGYGAAPRDRDGYHARPRTQTDNAADDRRDDRPTRKPVVADRTDVPRSDRPPPKRDSALSRATDGGSRHRSDRRRSRSSERRSSRSSRDEDDDRRRRRRTPPRRHADKRGDRGPTRDVDDFGRDPKQRKYTKPREDRPAGQDDKAKKASPGEKLTQADRADSGSRDKPYAREARPAPEKKAPHSSRPCEKRDSSDVAKKPSSNSGSRSERDTNQKTEMRPKSHETKPDSERGLAHDKKPLLATPDIANGRGPAAKKIEGDAPRPLMGDLPHVRTPPILIYICNGVTVEFDIYGNETSHRRFSSRSSCKAVYLYCRSRYLQVSEEVYILGLVLPKKRKTVRAGVEVIAGEIYSKNFEK